MTNFEVDHAGGLSSPLLTAALLFRLAPGPHRVPLVGRCLRRRPGRTSSPRSWRTRAGNSLMVWTRSDGTNTRVQARFRAAGGTWSPAATISIAGPTPTSHRLAIDPGGNAIVVWTQSTAPRLRTHAAVRPAGGSFGADQTISPSGPGRRSLPRSRSTRAGRRSPCGTPTTGLPTASRRREAARGRSVRAAQAISARALRL